MFNDFATYGSYWAVLRTRIYVGPRAAGGEDQERGTIQGVVGSRVRATRAACGSCRFSRATQRVVMLWGGELNLRCMRGPEASMKLPWTPRQMSVPVEFSIRTGEITAIGDWQILTAEIPDEKGLFIVHLALRIVQCLAQKIIQPQNKWYRRRVPDLILDKANPASGGQEIDLARMISTAVPADIWCDLPIIAPQFRSDT
ncbi:hypothetical protein B0H13DRAFT_1922131 [Mycena leptocephala]|nr:hypothetical protein B0H13DRAFT_1922131 [Mycena leptocephala]